VSPLSDWLDIMLEEIERKKHESVAAAQELEQRSQPKYVRNSPGNSADSSGSSSDAGSGTEL
jgi:hypothetical protein